MLDSIARRFRSRKQTNRQRTTTRQRKLRSELLEDRRLLAVGDLVGSLFPVGIGSQASTQEGYSVAIGTSYIASGKPLADLGGATDTGAVEVYDSSTNSHVLTIENPEPSDNDQFGHAVAMSGDRLVVGAYRDNGLAGSVYLYDLSEGAAELTSIITSPTASPADYFGHAVDISGDTLVVGAHLEDPGAVNAGSVYVYDLDSDGPTLNAVINSPQLTANGYFGYAVALDGETLVVGATLEADFSGQIHAFDLSGSSPEVVASFMSPTAASGDEFGSSLATEGGIVVVGAPGSDSGGTDSGVVYMYELSSGGGGPTLTIDNPTPASGDRFGSSVDFSLDRAIVGAFEDDTGASNAGSAYVFDLSTGTIASLVAAMHAPNLTAGDHFGFAVAIDGNDVVVGARSDDTVVSHAGAAYRFDLLNSASDPTAALYRETARTAQLNTEFGYSVAASGNTVAVGSLRDSSVYPEAGLVSLYDLTNGVPLLTSTLHHPSPGFGDEFGKSVAVDENIVVVGAPKDDTGATDAGSAFVFDLSGAEPVLVATVNNPDPQASDWFGHSVAVSGETIVVGAFLDDAGALDAGSAYVYKLVNGAAVLEAELHNPAPGQSEWFGFSVAASGGRAVVGTYNDLHAAAGSGTVYVYDVSVADPFLTDTLTNPLPLQNDFFGYSVAIEDDTLVVGAYGADEALESNSGSALVYDLSLGVTTLVATLSNPSPFSSDEFGYSVAVSGDSVVVGARGDDFGEDSAGSIYLYEVGAAAVSLKASIGNPTPRKFDFFGGSVAASENFVVSGANLEDGQAANQGAAYVFEGLAPNAAPIANDDIVTAYEDFEIFIDVLADNGNGSDSDVDGNIDPMLTTELAPPANGTLVNNFDGTFTYTSSPEFSGTDSFTYQIEDTNGETSVATVSITVLPVNDIPSFTVGPNVAAAAGSGPQSFNSPVDAWVTDLSAGPNEDSQSLTFLITGNSDPSLFTAGPAISADGILTFTPAAGVEGTAVITTVLVDDGGTENGGIDSSDEQFFEITIEASNSQPSFDVANYSFSLDENSDVDHVVGTVSASDPDSADALTYSITSGNTGNAFKIDSGGVIRVENFEAVDFEVNPVFNLTVQVDDGSGSPNATSTANVTISLNDLQTTLFVSDPLFDSSTENGGEANFQIEIFGDAIGFGFDVNYETEDGTATSSSTGLGGDDYSSVSDTLSFSGSIDREFFLVDVFYNNDNVVEAEEDFFLKIVSVVGTNDVDIQRDTARAVIIDDDQATVILGDASVAEGNSGSTTLSFPVSLDAPVDVDISFDYGTADDSATVVDTDFQASSASFTISAGETLGQIDIVVNGDEKVELDESLTLFASNLQAMGRSVTLVGTGTGTAGNFSLLEDFQTGTVGNPVGGNVAANGNNWNADSLFVVTEDPADSTNLVLTNNSNVSSDKTALLPIGNTGTGKTVTFYYEVKAEELSSYGTGIGLFDGDGVGNQLKTAWTQLVDGPGIRGIGANPPLDVQNVNQDEWYSVWMVLDLADDSNPQTNDRMKAYVAGPGLDGQVPLTHANGTGDEFRFNSYNGNGLTDLIIFAHGGSQSASNFYLDSFYLDDSGANLSSPFVVTATGTIQNDDAATITVSEASTVEGNSGTTTLSFPVEFSHSVDVDVTFDYQTQDGTGTVADSDYVPVNTQTFTIPAGSTSGQIDVLVNGDERVELDELLALITENVQASGRDVTLASNSSNDSDWTQLGSSITGEATGDLSGWSVASSADGNTVIVGSTSNDGNGENSGHARVFRYDGNDWNQLGADIDGDNAYDQAGTSVAISADGNTVIIGAIWNDGSATNSGHARIFRFDGNAWIQLGSDIDGEASSDRSGYAVAMSADGNTVVVTARDSDGAGSDSGHARVFSFDGSDWIQIGGDIDGEASGDSSGWSVAMASDGQTIAIGAIFNDGNGSNSGHARVYRLVNNSWTQIGADIDGEAAGDNSGYSVSMNSDGNRVSVGAISNDGNGTDAGQVRVFEFDGTNWIQIGSDINGDNPGDGFGLSVDMSADGNTIVVGGPFASENGANSGEAKIYRFDGADWNQLANILDGEFAGDQTGWAVAISADGSKVAIGEKHNALNGNNSGRVRMFEMSPSPTVAIGTIENDDSAVITVGDASVVEGDDGTSVLSFPVEFSHPVDVDVSFDYQTLEGTATLADADYVDIPPSLQFTMPAGSTFGTIEVIVNGDEAVEIDESLGLVVSNLQASGRDVQFADTLVDQSNLLDSGAASPSSSVTWQQEVIVGESGQLTGLTIHTSGAGDFNLAINLGQPLQSDPDDFATVVTATEAGAQFVDLTQADLFLNAGDRFAFKVNGINDGPQGGFRTSTGDAYPGRFYLNGSQRVNTDLIFKTHMTQVGVETMSAAGTIINDDQATLTVSSFTEPEDGTFEFTVTTDKAVSEDITVGWATFETPGQAVAGSDFTAASFQSATIPAGQTTATFTVDVIDDSVVEADEFFRVRIFNERIGGEFSPSRLTIGDANGFGAIADNDQALLTVGNAEVAEGNDGTAVLRFPIALSKPVDADVTFDYRTQDGEATAADSDYTAISPPFQFTILAGETSAFIDVVINGDNQVEADESLQLVLSNLNSSGRNVELAENVLDQDNAPDNTGAIVGSDTYTYQQEVIVGESGVLAGVELFTSGAGDFNFAINRGAPWQTDADDFSMVVTATVAGRQYIDLTSANLFFASSERFVIEVQGIGNGPQGGFRFTPDNPYPGSLYRNGTTSGGIFNNDLAFRTHMQQAGAAEIAGTGVIVNDDQANLSITDVAQNEDGDFVFTISTDKLTSEDVTVLVNTVEVGGEAEPGNDYSSMADQLATIEAGSLSTTVTVEVLDDDAVEDDEIFWVRLTNERFGGAFEPTRLRFSKSTGIATILNDDAAPIANAGGPYSIPEGSGVSLDGSASTDADLPAQQLNYRWDIDGDGTFDFDAGTSPVLSLSWQDLVARGIDNGPYLGDVIVEVSDGTNVDSATATLSVLNSAPTLTINESALVMTEGTSTSRAVTVGDIATDVVTLSASLGVLTDNGEGNWTWTYDALDDLATTSVVFTASDNDGASTIKQFALTVENAAPSLAMDTSPITISEGSSTSKVITATDVAADVVTLSTSIGTLQSTGANSWLWTYEGVDDLATSNVILSAEDEDGGLTNASFNLTVLNEVPTATISGPNNGVTAQNRKFTLSASDLGTADTEAGFTYEIDWDGDGVADEVAPGGESIDILHAFTGAGTYDVGVTATDKDGGVSLTSSTTIVIVASRMQGDNLIVGGTSGNDTISFEPGPNPGDIEAFLNGVSLGIYQPTGELRAFGDAGDDTIIVDAAITLATNLKGEEGNDTILGGAGPDRITGGDGDDNLSGRNGDDFIKGNSGVDTISGGADNDELFGGGDSDTIDGNGGNDILRGGGAADILNGGSGADILLGDGGGDSLDGGGGKDILIGGNGKDLLAGAGGADILIGSSTTHDANNEALSAILSEWNSSNSYNKRTANLRDGSGTGTGLNGGFYLAAGSTVLDDGKVDEIEGGSSRDWYFAAADDVLSDLVANELVEEL